VLADFTNTTGESIFDDSLKQALSVQLSQSPFLNLLSEDKLNVALKLAGMESEVRLSQKTALEVCRRTNSRVLITGSISHNEDRYVIVLKALACASGEVVEQDQAESVSRGAVLPALGKAASSLRAKLGESLNTIQKYDTPIAQATTPSLEALKAYSEGVRMQRQSGDLQAVPFLLRAVELDPNFALAYSDLGVAYFNREEHGLSKQNYQKAFELRNRASEREAYHIAADYYDSVTGEVDKAEEVYKTWAKAYPRDATPLGNLATNYAWEGKTEQSMAINIQVLRLNPDDGITYANLLGDYAALNRLDEAKAIYEQALNGQHDSPYLRVNRYAVAFLEGDEAEMQRQMAWAGGNSEVEDTLLSFEADTQAYFGHFRKARELSTRAVEVAERNGRKETAATWMLTAALREAEVGNVWQARKLIRSALALRENRELQVLAALASARTGDVVRATQLADVLSHSYPRSSVLNRYWLPTIRSAIDLNHNPLLPTTELFQTATSYELGSPPPVATSGGPLYPVYVRGEAYLKTGQADKAALEFRKIIANRSIVQNVILGALAHLQLGRAEARTGAVEKSRKEYQDFLALWKDADSDIPIVKQARLEYARLGK
jgi:tetratricopeptide (TPR) repeat protein